MPTQVDLSQLAQAGASPGQAVVWNGAKWAPGSGGGGGMVTGTVPSLPASLVVLDQVSIATHRTTTWALDFLKGGLVMSLEVTGTHDGTVPYDVRTKIIEGATGIYDLVITVDISGGNLRLTVTPGTTGWAVSWARTYSLAVA